MNWEIPDFHVGISRAARSQLALSALLELSGTGGDSLSDGVSVGSPLNGRRKGSTKGTFQSRFGVGKGLGGIGRGVERGRGVKREKGIIARLLRRHKRERHGMRKRCRHGTPI